jgi:hypothetical protein
MADNKTIDNGANADFVAATDEVTYSGETCDVPLMRPVHVSGAEGSRTVVAITDANGSYIHGNVADDAAEAGNPVGVGLTARTTNRTAVADGDRVRAIADDVGRQVVVLNHVRDLVVQQAATLSNTTETTILTAGAAGVFHDLTKLIVSNTSGVSTRVDFRDATAGSVVMSIHVAAGGGGAVLDNTVPIKQTTAANNWTAQCASTPTGGDVRIFVQGVKNV